MFVRYNVKGLLKRCYSYLALPLVNSNCNKLWLLAAPSCTVRTITRALSCSWTLRKYVPNQKDELDLDTWKSVMRSQASHEEKTKKEDEEDPLKDDMDSPVEVSRKLVEMWRQAGKLVPEHITNEQLETLAELTTKSSKRKYLKYLSIKEGHKKVDKMKKDKKKAERLAERKNEAEEMKGESDCEDGETKLKNTYLMQIWTRSMDKALSWRAAQAMQYGQPLVYDMSYDQHMSRRELENTVSQLLETEGWNRRSVDPFHLYLCNMQSEGAYQRELLKRYGQEAWDRLLITSTSQRHVDLFPHENLVYLTADSPNVLRTYDHSKVYIIGAMVDRSIQSGVSLANAKRLKLATARLPLDEYLHWDTGAKNLTLDQMIRILMTAKETGSWKKALEFVPKRKHDGFHQERRGSASNMTEPLSKTLNKSKDSKNKLATIFLSKQRLKREQENDVNAKAPFAPVKESGQRNQQNALRGKVEQHTKARGKRNWWEEEQNF